MRSAPSRPLDVSEMSAVFQNGRAVGDGGSPGGDVQARR
jgi:hypothetical protein